jgi:prophage tail gpP-like protein
MTNGTETPTQWIDIHPTRPANSLKALDQATVIVEDFEYEDWESVWVQIGISLPYSMFRFTAVERDTPRDMFYDIQFVPGEKCLVNLGGVTIIKGYIELRQGAYDGTRHGVEITGSSATRPIARSSVNTKTGNFDGMSFRKVVEKVLEGYPVGFKILGTLDDTPFDKLQNQPGEQIWDFLEAFRDYGADLFRLSGNRTLPNLERIAISLSLFLNYLV